MWVATATLAGVGALLIALALPLWLGRMPPNHWYGFRTPRIVADERLWYPANAMAGRALAAMGALFVALALLGGLGLIGELAVALAGGFAAPALMIWLMVRASMMAADIDAADVVSQSIGQEGGSTEPARTTRAPRPKQPEG